jgi:hypothetical protein
VAGQIVGHAGPPRNVPVPAVPMDHAQLFCDPHGIAAEDRPTTPGAQAVRRRPDGRRLGTGPQGGDVVRPASGPHARTVAPVARRVVSRSVQVGCSVMRTRPPVGGPWRCATPWCRRGCAGSGPVEPGPKTRSPSNTGHGLGQLYQGNQALPGVPLATVRSDAQDLGRPAGFVLRREAPNRSLRSWRCLPSPGTGVGHRSGRIRLSPCQLKRVVAVGDATSQPQP